MLWYRREQRRQATSAIYGELTGHRLALDLPCQWLRRTTDQSMLRSMFSIPLIRSRSPHLIASMSYHKCHRQHLGHFTGHLTSRILPPSSTEAVTIVWLMRADSCRKDVACNVSVAY